MPLARAVLLALALLAASVGPAAADCKVAVNPRGLTVLVGVRGEPGSVLWVSWGDGITSTAREAIGPGKDRLLLSHTYAQAGAYQVAWQFEAPGGGCRGAAGLELPVEADPDDEDLDVLPPTGAPVHADAADEGEGPMTRRPLPDRGQAGGGGILEALGRALRGLFGR